MGAPGSRRGGRQPLSKLQARPVFLAILAYHTNRSQFTSGAIPARLPNGRKSLSSRAQNGVDGRVGQESGRAVANRTLGPTARLRPKKRSIRMKKPLFLALLSVAAVSATARDSQAWFLDCCCRDKCCTPMCCRPYNAFSPCCCCCCCCCCAPYYGGYMPSNNWRNSYPAPYGPSYFNCPSYGPGCCTSGNCDVGCLPAPGSFSAAPGPGPVPTMPYPQQSIPGPQLQIPNPQVLNQSSYRMPMPTPAPMPPTYGFGFVQPAGYQAMNNPYYYAPPQAPAYWYGR
jgi:hypothetical protein